MKKIPLLVIAGATASGKTALSIALAKRFSAEVVSADSMQIYRHMDIGTAKPTPEEMGDVPHHLLDFQDPKAPFSVAEYVALAHTEIAEIHARGHLPIVAGGTGLYIDSLVRDVEFREDDTDERIRQELEMIAKEQGIFVLHTMLAEIDPVSAARIPAQNVRRVVRAIEFFRMTGKTISAHQLETQQKESRYDALMLAIRWEMPKLYQRIDQRVDWMVEAGLFSEVAALEQMGCKKEMSAMQGIGYKQVLNYRHGLATESETIQIIKRDSRRYAKRQMTWFRRNPELLWLDPSGAQKQADMAVLKKFSEIL